MKNIFGTFLLLGCKCWPEAPMACYDWKLHSKPSTTIQLHVYVVKSDLILVKISCLGRIKMGAVNGNVTKLVFMAVTLLVDIYDIQSQAYNSNPR